MEFLQTILDRLSDASFSNQVRTVVALLAVPGALWGVYLFIRWMRGRGLDAGVDKLQTQSIEMQAVLRELKAQVATLEISRQPVTSAPVVTKRRIAFFSYARNDHQFVYPVVQAYNALGEHVQLTRDASANWGDAVKEAIDRADVFILFWSHAAANSAAVRTEVMSALPRIEVKQLEFRVVVLEHPSPKPWPELQQFHFS